MRIMQIGNSHTDYLSLFSRRFKNKTTHAELMQAYIDDYYWCSHTLTPALERMGHETFLCLPSEGLSQRLWCEEYGVPWKKEAPLLTVLAQVYWFQPDILLVGSASIYNDVLLRHLPFTPRLVVGWHGTTTHPFMKFSTYDLILSSHEECLLMSKLQGAQRTAYFYPGIPAELKDKFTGKKHTDVCFSGYWSVSHPVRNQFLYELAARLPASSVNCAYHLGFYSDGPHCPEIVQRYNRGPVWGMAMFKAFAVARIVLNGYAKLNFGPQNLSPNMRQLEGMGVGSFMLTETSDNLEAFFTEGHDLATYASTEELVDKIHHYLHNEDEREAIAAQGLATCRKYYSMDVRARAFMDAVERVLNENRQPPLEVQVRTLHAMQSAWSHDSSSIDREDVRQAAKYGLEAARTLMLDNDMEKAQPLWQSLEALPVEGMKQYDLCRALRCLHLGDPGEAEKLLRSELDAWPENDAARTCLSTLIMHRKGKLTPVQAHKVPQGE